jgi:hypothetical protein
MTTNATPSYYTTPQALQFLGYSPRSSSVITSAIKAGYLVNIAERRPGASRADHKLTVESVHAHKARLDAEKLAEARRRAERAERRVARMSEPRKRATAAPKPAPLLDLQGDGVIELLTRIAVAVESLAKALK